MNRDFEYDVLNNALKKLVHRLTLPVAIHLVANLLKRMYPDEDFDELYEKVLFVGNPSLAFQKSDISSIQLVEHDEKVYVEITLNFMNIFGASSPLPTHYSERILEDSREASVLYDFLTMLNSRLKVLIYPIWQRYRYDMHYRHDLSDHFSKYILSFLGLYAGAKGEKTKIHNLHQLLPYSNLLILPHKSASSLVKIFRHYFGHQDISIEEGKISEVPIPAFQQGNLGNSNCTLGADFLVGTILHTRTIKFGIVFHHIRWKQLHDFSYYGLLRERMDHLLSLLLEGNLQYELSFRIAKEEIQPCVLGHDFSLGVNGWTSKPEHDQLITVYKL